MFGLFLICKASCRSIFVPPPISSGQNLLSKCVKIKFLVSDQGQRNVAPGLCPLTLVKVCMCVTRIGCRVARLAETLTETKMPPYAILIEKKMMEVEPEKGTKGKVPRRGTVCTIQRGGSTCKPSKK